MCPVERVPPDGSAIALHPGNSRNLPITAGANKKERAMPSVPDRPQTRVERKGGNDGEGRRMHPPTNEEPGEDLAREALIGDGNRLSRPDGRDWSLPQEKKRLMTRPLPDTQQNGDQLTNINGEGSHSNNSLQARRSHSRRMTYDNRNPQHWMDHGYMSRRRPTRCNEKGIRMRGAQHHRGVRRKTRMIPPQHRRAECASRRHNKNRRRKEHSALHTSHGQASRTNQWKQPNQWSRILMHGPMTVRDTRPRLRPFLRKEHMWIKRPRTLARKSRIVASHR